MPKLASYTTPERDGFCRLNMRTGINSRRQVRWRIPAGLWLGSAHSEATLWQAEEQANESQPSKSSRGMLDKANSGGSVTLVLKKMHRFSKGQTTPPLSMYMQEPRGEV